MIGYIITGVIAYGVGYHYGAKAAIAKISETGRKFIGMFKDDK